MNLSDPFGQRLRDGEEPMSKVQYNLYVVVFWSNTNLPSGRDSPIDQLTVTVRFADWAKIHDRTDPDFGLYVDRKFVDVHWRRTGHDRCDNNYSYWRTTQHDENSSSANLRLIVTVITD